MAAQNLGRFVVRTPERFELLDTCKCGGFILATIIRRDHVPELLEAIESELHGTATVFEEEIDMKWHEQTVDHLIGQLGTLYRGTSG
jgi:hypothetical protein